jgi:hypothetical protein
MLLTGADLKNPLLGVLIRFKREAIAFIADIEQMFSRFLVIEKDCHFLRFLWFQNNDLSKDIVDYRMNATSLVTALHLQWLFMVYTSLFKAATSTQMCSILCCMTSTLMIG